MYAFNQNNNKAVNKFRATSVFVQINYISTAITLTDDKKNVPKKHTKKTEHKASTQQKNFNHRN